MPDNSTAGITATGAITPMNRNAPENPEPSTVPAAVGRAPHNTLGSYALGIEQSVRQSRAAHHQRLDVRVFLRERLTNILRRKSNLSPKIENLFLRQPIRLLAFVTGRRLQLGRSREDA